MSCRRGLASAALVLFVVTQGCRAPLEGTSSFEVLTAPAQLFAPPQSDKELEKSDIRIDYIPVRPQRQLTTPQYPPAALAARAGEHIVYVTLTVDETGRVTDVYPSWGKIPPPSRFADEFLEAVRVTVAQWRLDPARQVYWRNVPGGDDRYLRTEPVSETMEIKFTFEASGTVR